ncbi:NAD(P)H-binding protein [Tessaracoccus sp. MC1865]|nr:NAD(P)H-binding protein [Tessaracoccus sp. MC1865]
MARIVIIGGTGYAGSNIVREASSRGHEVTAVSRHVPDEKTDAVTYRTCDVSDPDAVREMVAGADVVATALSPAVNSRAACGRSCGRSPRRPGQRAPGWPSSVAPRRWRSPRVAPASSTRTASRTGSSRRPPRWPGCWRTCEAATSRSTGSSSAPPVASVRSRRASGWAVSASAGTCC